MKNILEHDRCCRFCSGELLAESCQELREEFLRKREPTTEEILKIFGASWRQSFGRCPRIGGRSRRKTKACITSRAEGRQGGLNMFEALNGNGASVGSTDAAAERDAMNKAIVLNAGDAVNTAKRWERNLIRRINRHLEEDGRKVVIVRGRNNARTPYSVDLKNPIKDLRVVAERCGANAWEDTLALDMERHLIKALREGGVNAARGKYRGGSKDDGKRP
jgi:hypothetical protein